MRFRTSSQFVKKLAAWSVLFVVAQLAHATSTTDDCVQKRSQVIEATMKVDLCLVGLRTKEGQLTDIVIAMRQTYSNVGKENLYLTFFGSEVERRRYQSIYYMGKRLTKLRVPPTTDSKESDAWSKPLVYLLQPNQSKVEEFKITDLLLQPLEASALYVLVFDSAPPFRKESESDTPEAWHQRSKLLDRNSMPHSFVSFRGVRLK